jgi:polysaccharide deacetylase family protein (PEP-CTERM system associated)
MMNMKPNKIAVLSMDIEDWYHTEYLKGTSCDRSYTMLDGLDVFAGILEEHNIRGTFFVLGELVEPIKDRLRDLQSRGHEIASHGWQHDRPITISTKSFARELGRCKKTLEDALGSPTLGYRAACFSLDRDHLQTIIDTGFGYDSSRIRFAENPLYGSLKLDDFTQLSKNIARKDGFFEFEISTLPMMGRNIPVAGGGYLRIFPWLLMKSLVRPYIRSNDLYVLYVHPMDLSRKTNAPLPKETSRLQQLRFNTGRQTTAGKIRKLIALLEESGYRFRSFASLRKELMEESHDAP